MATLIRRGAGMQSMGGGNTAIGGGQGRYQPLPNFPAAPPVQGFNPGGPGGFAGGNPRTQGVDNRQLPPINHPMGTAPPNRRRGWVRPHHTPPTPIQQVQGNTQMGSSQPYFGGNQPQKFGGGPAPAMTPPQTIGGPGIGPPPMATTGMGQPGGIKGGPTPEGGPGMGSSQPYFGGPTQMGGGPLPQGGPPMPPMGGPQGQLPGGPPGGFQGGMDPNDPRRMGQPSIQDQARVMGQRRAMGQMGSMF